MRATYGRRLREISNRPVGGTSSANLYVQAIRWASDRLNAPDDNPNRPGVIAFVHPNSLSNATSLAGMRAALRDEFIDIYVVNLLGDAMKSGDEFRREGDKIFGAGSRNGVQITVLVRNPHKDQTAPASLHYAQVPEYSRLHEKFDWLTDLRDVTSDRFQIVPVTKGHDWVNLTDGTFQTLLPVCSTAKKGHNTEVAVAEHATGVKTNCDVYVYSFSREKLESKIRQLIEAYQLARESMELGSTIDELTKNDHLESIKWTETLKQSLRNDEDIYFDESRIREVLYRPFTKIWLYEDARILSRVKTISGMLPREREREESSSRLKTIAAPSQPSRQIASATSTSWAQTKAGHEPSRGGGDLDHGDLQHDLSSNSDRSDPRPSNDRGIEADPDAPPLDAMTPFTLLGGSGRGSVGAGCSPWRVGLCPPVV